jgi:hypothetical protein
MLASQFGRWIGSCAAVCVLLLFLFPLVHGPFQATHGPTTAFRARRAFVVLIISVMQACLGAFTGSSLFGIGGGLSERLRPSLRYPQPLDPFVMRC